MSEICFETDYVNCKYRENSSICETHDKRSPSIQTTLPQLYILLRDRRAKRYAHHEQKRQRDGRNPNLPRRIMTAHVVIVGPSFNTGRLINFSPMSKKFIHERRKSEVRPKSFYTTIAGVAKPGSGIEIKDRG